MRELYPGFETYVASTILSRGEWVAEEYEAGYRARGEGAPESITATPCWQIGWQEADRELAVLASPQKASDADFFRNGFQLYAASGSGRSVSGNRHGLKHDTVLPI